MWRQSHPQTSAVKINKKTVTQFARQITPQMETELIAAMGRIAPITSKAHTPYPSKIEDKAFMGKFYNLFIKKVICNIQNIDCSYDIIENYASVFPFEISKDLALQPPKIVDQYDDKFKTDITLFLNEHFDNVGYETSTIQFLTNINQHYLDNNVAYKKPPTSSVAEELSTLAISRSTKQPAAADFLPRLNIQGIRRFESIRDIVKKTTEIFTPDNSKTISFEMYDEKYFANLSEITFVEIYSLLDAQFYRDNLTLYTKRFKKYLFFFLHASKNSPNPVCFVDDLLYECLKSLQTFKKSRLPAEQLKSHIALLVCVCLRKFDCTDRMIYDPITSHLRLVSQFIHHIPSIQTAILDYKTAGAFPENWIFFCTNREIFEVCFSVYVKNTAKFFVPSFISAALSPEPFETSTIYNAFLGTKVSANIPDSAKKNVAKFVQKYNSYDCTNVTAPGDFLKEDFEGCFELATPSSAKE